MGKEINLLPKKNTNLLQQERTILAIRLVAIFSIIVVVCSILATFFLGQANSVDTVTQEQQAMEAKIQQLKPKIQKEIVLVQRTNQIQAILQKRSSVVTKATKLQNLIPSGVSTDTFSITGNQFSIALSSSSLSLLTSCIDAFTNALKTKTLFSTITVNNVSVDAKSGTYKVNVQGIFL